MLKLFLRLLLYVKPLLLMSRKHREWCWSYELPWASYIYILKWGKVGMVSKCPPSQWYIIYFTLEIKVINYDQTWQGVHKLCGCLSPRTSEPLMTQYFWAVVKSSMLPRFLGSQLGLRPRHQKRRFAHCWKCCVIRFNNIFFLTENNQCSFESSGMCCWWNNNNKLMCNPKRVSLFTSHGKIQGEIKRSGKSQIYIFTKVFESEIMATN